MMTVWQQWFCASRKGSYFLTAESKQRLAAVCGRYHGSASHCKPRPHKAALAGYGERVLTGARKGRSEEREALLSRNFRSEEGRP